MCQSKPLLLRIQDTAALRSVGRTKVYQLIRAGMPVGWRYACAESSG
jgi:hypothetical protein